MHLLSRPIPGTPTFSVGRWFLSSNTCIACEQPYTGREGRDPHVSRKHFLIPSPSGISGPNETAAPRTREFLHSFSSYSPNLDHQTKLPRLTPPHPIKIPLNESFSILSSAPLPHLHMLASCIPQLDGRFNLESRWDKVLRFRRQGQMGDGKIFGGSGGPQE